MENSAADWELSHYRIKVKGYLAKQWTGWFDNMEIEYEEDSTVLTGCVIDQAALYGILNRMRDLNLTLLLVERIDSR